MRPPGAGQPEKTASNFSIRPPDVHDQAKPCRNFVPQRVAESVARLPLDSTSARQ
jgi:hypothetical protein